MRKIKLDPTPSGKSRFFIAASAPKTVPIACGPPLLYLYSPDCLWFDTNGLCRAGEVGSPIDACNTGRPFFIQISHAQA
jgi:hypothetical protein